jgi:hypothetical protein
LAVGDLDHNGKPNVITASGDISVLLGNGDGTMRPGPGHVIGTEVWGVAAGYFDGDQMLDLAVTRGDETTTGTVVELKGRRRGAFQTLNYYPVDVQPISVAAGDLNGDGWPDLAVANRRGDDVSVLLNLGDGPNHGGRNVAGRVAAELAFPADVADGRSSSLTPASTAAAVPVQPARCAPERMVGGSARKVSQRPTPAGAPSGWRQAVKGSSLNGWAGAVDLAWTLPDVPPSDG